MVAGEIHTEEELEWQSAIAEVNKKMQDSVILGAAKVTMVLVQYAGSIVLQVLLIGESVVPSQVLMEEVQVTFQEELAKDIMGDIIARKMDGYFTLNAGMAFTISAAVCAHLIASMA